MNKKVNLSPTGTALVELLHIISENGLYQPFPKCFSEVSKLGYTGRVTFAKNAETLKMFTITFDVEKMFSSVLPKNIDTDDLLTVKMATCYLASIWSHKPISDIKNDAKRAVEKGAFIINIDVDKFKYAFQCAEKKQLEEQLMVKAMAMDAPSDLLEILFNIPSFRWRELRKNYHITPPRGRALFIDVVKGTEYLVSMAAELGKDINHPSVWIMACDLLECSLKDMYTSIKRDKTLYQKFFPTKDKSPKTNKVTYEAA